MPSTGSSSPERHLSKADPVMRRLIREHGACPIAKRNTGTLFHSLASAIIAQQLSVKAADTIQKRVMQLVSNPLTPRAYLATEPDALRSAGLSRSKALYIRNLAEAVENGLTKRTLQVLSDADAIKTLTSIKGIGQWTAEMYLIFGMHRPDVVSFGDAGLQRAARELYNNGKAKTGMLEQVSETWKPYRSTACWYLWRSLHNEPL